jgi:hypothetical protein
VGAELPGSRKAGSIPSTNTLQRVEKATGHKPVIHFHPQRISPPVFPADLQRIKAGRGVR